MNTRRREHSSGNKRKALNAINEEATNNNEESRATPVLLETPLNVIDQNASLAMHEKRKRFTTTSLELTQFEDVNRSSQLFNSTQSQVQIYIVRFDPITKSFFL